MFSPQRLWPSTPASKSGNLRSNVPASVPASALGSVHGETSQKGKGVVGFLDGGNGVMEQDSFSERASSLEKELFEYQYNMGLLLIEKKEWTAKHEEVRQALADALEALKREQTAHAMVISEVEKREETLKKALGVERQCVLDLEKALRDMRSEYAEVTVNANFKLTEANAIITSVEEKSLEVEAKFHAADAKLAEMNRKSSEIEMKLHELVIQENALRRERASFDAERETHDSSVSKQREDLQEWEKKLLEAEGRLADSRRMLKLIEERASENDKLLKEKQSDIEELRKKIEATSSNLRIKEDDVNRRIVDLVLQEKEAGDFAKRLEEKEKQLSELEDKLNLREKVEMQKLLDEHKCNLDEKQKAYELEIENKRMQHEEKLKNKLVEVEEKEAEIAHMEEKVAKREQAAEGKMEKIREKEMDFDSKSKALEEKENSLRMEMENLERHKQQFRAEKGDLLRVKADLEKLKTETDDLLLKLKEERGQLEVTEEERKEHVHLQSELKHEIERYRLLHEQLLAEADALKLEKENFEKEWDELDDKRSAIRKEHEDVLEQRRCFEKHRLSEEERLQREKQETHVHVQRELRDLELAKESFVASMEHDKSTLAEKMQSEKSQFTQDFERKKQELESELQSKLEDMKCRLLEREKSFEKQRETELSNINYLREVARRETEEVNLEKSKIENEKMNILQTRDHLEAQQRELKKDIEELVGLSEKLKFQREQFLRERERFTAFLDKQKNCNNCEEVIREFMLSDLHPLTEMENIEAPSLPKLAEDYLKEKAEVKAFAESSPAAVKSRSPIASGTISWLRSCTSRIFKLSPGLRLDLDTAEGSLGASEQSAGEGPDFTKALPSSGGEQRPFNLVIDDSFSHKIGESNGDIKVSEHSHAPPVDQDSLSIPETSQNSGMKTRGRRLPAGYQANGNREGSVHSNDQSIALLDKTNNSKRKRNRTTHAAESEDKTEGQSDSVWDSARPNRRQRVAEAETEAESLGKKRYNLRQPKKPSVTATNGTTPQVRKGKAQGRGRGRGIGNNEVLLSLEPKKSGKLETGEAATHTTSSAAASEFSADSPMTDVGSTQIRRVGTLDASARNRVFSEEVNEIAEETASRNERRSYEEDMEDGDESEVHHPADGEASKSIGKRILTFLLT